MSTPGMTVYAMSMHYYDGQDQGNPKLRVVSMAVSADGWPELQ